MIKLMTRRQVQQTAKIARTLNRCQTTRPFSTTIFTRREHKFPENDESFNWGAYEYEFHKIKEQNKILFILVPIITGVVLTYTWYSYKQYQDMINRITDTTFIEDESYLDRSIRNLLQLKFSDPNTLSIDELRSLIIHLSSVTDRSVTVNSFEMIAQNEQLLDRSIAIVNSAVAQNKRAREEPELILLQELLFNSLNVLLRASFVDVLSVENARRIVATARDVILRYSQHEQITSLAIYSIAFGCMVHIMNNKPDLLESVTNQEFIDMAEWFVRRRAKLHQRQVEMVKQKEREAELLVDTYVKRSWNREQVTQFNTYLSTDEGLIPDAIAFTNLLYLIAETEKGRELILNSHPCMKMITDNMNGPIMLLLPISAALIVRLGYPSDPSERTFQFHGYSVDPIRFNGSAKEIDLLARIHCTRQWYGDPAELISSPELCHKLKLLLPEAKGTYLEDYIYAILPEFAVQSKEYLQRSYNHSSNLGKHDAFLILQLARDEDNLGTKIELMEQVSTSELHYKWLTNSLRTIRQTDSFQEI